MKYLLKTYLENRMQDEYARICKSICNYFCESSRFDAEEEYKEIHVEWTQYKNPYAVKRIAEYYRDGVFLPQSDKEYIRHLKLFVENINIGDDYVRIAWDMLEEDSYNYWMPRLGAEEWTRLADMGEVCKILGLYYSGFNELEALRSADYYLRIALGAHFDVKEDYDKVRQRERVVQVLRDNPTDMTGVPEYIRANTGLNANDLYYAGEISLKESFGDVWIKLSSEAKAHLKTALLTYSQYFNCGPEIVKDLDFSAVVSLLSRALEYEISRFFYTGYVQYLKQRCRDADDYLLTISLPLVKWKKKDIILRQNDDGTIRFVDFDSDENYFSFGKMYALTGFRDNQVVEKVFLDRTCLDYCREHTDLGTFADIKIWIKQLIDAVEQLREARNKSSHGGTVLNTYDAEFAFEQIVWVRKIMLLLKKPMLD